MSSRGQPESTNHEPPYDLVAESLLNGEVTLFLGAGLNLFGREPRTWKKGSPFLPDGSELAGHLASAFEFEGESEDLARVSQFAVLKRTELPLFRELHEIFATGTDEPNAVHHFLAGFEQQFVRGRLHPYGPPPPPLIVTTNYDDALERAFTDVAEPFDLLVYRTDAQGQGSFLHRSSDGTIERTVEDGSTYGEELLKEHGVILKIHGTAQRGGLPARDSYVITEDHYIEYLAHSNIATLLPRPLLVRMKETHFLFLGYSMRDWNLRAFLHRIWSDRNLEVGTWSIQLAPNQLERMFWANRGLDIFDTALETFLPRLGEELERLARPRAPEEGA